MRRCQRPVPYPAQQWQISWIAAGEARAVESPYGNGFIAAAAAAEAGKAVRTSRPRPGSCPTGEEQRADLFIAERIAECMAAAYRARAGAVVFKKEIQHIGVGVA